MATAAAKAWPLEDEVTTIRKSFMLRISLTNQEPSTHGTTRTCQDVWYLVVFGGKADISQWLPKIAIYEYTP
jgi:hypothetical protein